MARMNDDTRPRVVKGPVAAAWVALRRPSARFSLGLLLLVGGAVGIGVSWGAGAALERVSSNAYCTSCHEMRVFVRPDHVKSSHFTNRAGVRAACADCHAPTHYAFKDLLANWQGTIATRELYDAKRRVLAERVWARLEADGSQTCRDCHGHDAMDAHAQSAEAVTMMEFAVEEGKRTCITCHKGVAHTIPNDWRSSAAR